MATDFCERVPRNGHSASEPDRQEHSAVSVKDMKITLVKLLDLVKIMQYPYQVARARYCGHLEYADIAPRTVITGYTSLLPLRLEIRACIYAGIRARQATVHTVSPIAGSRLRQPSSACMSPVVLFYFYGGAPCPLVISTDCKLSH